MAEEKQKIKENEISESVAQGSEKVKPKVETVKQQEKKKKKKQLNNINYGESINLIPRKTEKEVKVEKAKSGFNIGGALAILVLVIISLVIVGYNFIIKKQLEREKNVLVQELESEAKKDINIIDGNHAIKTKLDLYKDVEEQTLPYKEILLYWYEVSNSLGTIEEITISENLSFQITGKADDLEGLAKIWHFMCVDESIVDSNLADFSASNDSATFEFTGQLNYDYFIKGE